MMFFESSPEGGGGLQDCPRDAQVRLARAGPGLGMEVNEKRVQ